MENAELTRLAAAYLASHPDFDTHLEIFERAGRDE